VPETGVFGEKNVFPENEPAVRPFFSVTRRRVARIIAG
jgi:hypothetical protein